MENEVWGEIYEKEYCEEHKVWWQPSISVTGCPACNIIESGEFIPETEHDEEIQKRDDEIDKLEKRIELILDNVQKLQESTEWELDFEYGGTTKKEIHDGVKSFKELHSEACNIIILEDF